MSTGSPVVWFLNPKSLWTTWGIACIAVLSIHALTLTQQPLVYQDEVQIVEIGRTVLHPNTDWSINWLIDEKMAKLGTSWPTTLIQELAYRLTAPSSLGSRLVTVLSGIIASTCLLGWLLCRGTRAPAAFLLALAFHFDPVFADNVRGGGSTAGHSRPASVHAGYYARSTSAAYPLWAQGLLLIAGMLAGFSPLLWLSAAILMPLVLLELYYLAHSYAGSQKAPWAAAVRPCLLFGVGGIVGFALGLLPAAAHWSQYWLSIQAAFEVQSMAAVIKTSPIDLLATHDPLIFVAAVTSLLFNREWGLLAALAAGVILIYQTMVYLPRVMYLLPYLWAMVAGAVSTVPRRAAAYRARRYVIGPLLSLVLIWNLGATLLVRPAIALSQSPANDPQQILNQLRQTVGTGPKRVLVEEWSAYFAGRELGWQQFRYTKSSDRARYLEFLGTMDFLVLRQSPVARYTMEVVALAGFELYETKHFEPAETMQLGMAHLEFFIPGLSYPSLNIYRRLRTEQP